MGNFNFEMEERLHDALRIRAVKDKKNMDDVVIEALKKYLY